MNCRHDETTLQCCKVIKVYDGDTITVNCPTFQTSLGRDWGLGLKALTPLKEDHQEKSLKLNERICEKTKALDPSSCFESIKRK